MTIALQALLLVEKAERVQVHFSLRLRDQWSKQMHDACKIYMVHVSWSLELFSKPNPPIRVGS